MEPENASIVVKAVEAMVLRIQPSIADGFEPCAPLIALPDAQRRRAAVQTLKLLNESTADRRIDYGVHK
jgi:hypothetical protein